MRTYFNCMLVGVGLLALGFRDAPAAGVLALEGGSAEQSTARYGLAAQWHFGQPLLAVGGWFLDGYVEASLAYWDADGGSIGNDSLIDGSIAAVLRCQKEIPLWGIAPYLEGGIGLHGLSEDTIGNRDLGGQFHFGSHAGVGVRFGQGNRFELGYRYQHLSNAGLDHPNPGIDFHLVRLAYHF